MSPALRCTAGLLLIAVFAPDHHDVGGGGGGGDGGGGGGGDVKHQQCQWAHELCVFQRQCHSASTYSSF